MEKKQKLLTASFSALGVLLVGSILFHFVEGWRYFDALYYSLITLTTVGYGDFSPATDLGKIISMIYIIFGIGILLAFIDILSEHRKERTVKRKAKKKQ